MGEGAGRLLGVVLSPDNVSVHPPVASPGRVFLNVCDHDCQAVNRLIVDWRVP